MPEGKVSVCPTGTGTVEGKMAAWQSGTGTAEGNVLSVLFTYLTNENYAIVWRCFPFESGFVEFNRLLLWNNINRELHNAQDSRIACVCVLMFIPFIPLPCCCCYIHILPRSVVSCCSLLYCCAFSALLPFHYMYFVYLTNIITYIYKCMRVIITTTDNRVSLVSSESSVLQYCKETVTVPTL